MKTSTFLLSTVLIFAGHAGLFIFLTNPAMAEPERFYQTRWCAEHQGETEVVLSDRTRVDCVTDTHAVEVDLAPKWAQAIGQALDQTQHRDRSLRAAD